MGTHTRPHGSRCSSPLSQLPEPVPERLNAMTVKSATLTHAQALPDHQ